MSISINSCTSSKHIGEGQYLLSKTSIEENGFKVKNKALYSLLKQQPNKRFLGIAPLKLALYNLASPKKENSYLKKMGENPVILNYRLARKSVHQIELYYKNKGYLDAKVTFNSSIKKHKAKAIYSISSGHKYKIGAINIDLVDDGKFKELLNKLIEGSKIKTGYSYNFKDLEEERNRIALRIQNNGYYKFNKEYIHYLADTNQTKKIVDLNLIIKNVESNRSGTLLKEDHKIGVIGEINIFLSQLEPHLNDTTIRGGINFIYPNGTPPFNLNRLIEKVLLRSGLLYNKTFVDKTYQSLSELKNFKKISIEFSSLESTDKNDLLSANIILLPGKKIAYSLEAEATSNPVLNEGVSGSATLSHYNLFKGAEHIQLTYKGSSNFNNISENGLGLSLTIPSLISPFKLNKILNKNSRTKTIFNTSVSKQERPQFTRNSITASYGYQWKTRKTYHHKLTLFNFSYVNFEGDSTDLSQISEYLIAKDYSNHLIPTSSYSLTFNNQNINKLKSHSYFKLHLESSGAFLSALAKPLNFEELKDEHGVSILQDNGKPSYTLNLWNNKNIYTQYLKASLDYRYYWEIDKKNNIAFRAMTGIIYAYGNTSQAPFHKKFIAGGTNDLRGWKAFNRPTGMLSDSDTLYTGGLKLLSSLEYRFNVLKKLKGAVFIDAGNIWELKANNTKYSEANFSWSNFSNEIAIDIGLGLRYDFQYFILRTDIGFPIREPNQSKKLQWDKVNLNDSQLNIGLGYPF